MMDSLTELFFKTKMLLVSVFLEWSPPLTILPLMDGVKKKKKKNCFGLSPLKKLLKIVQK
jgi:hypothetical protein